MKIALGTVQFGLDYGISNPKGKVPLEEVKKILKLAASFGIDMLDTAHSYGESEQTIGAALSPRTQFLKIVTKTKPIGDKSVESVVKGVSLSLERLKITSVYGLLIHHSGDLAGEKGRELFEALTELKREGKVQKLGVSIYDGLQIDSVLDRFTLEIMQVPVNLLDQRLRKSGHLRKLKEQGVEIHARSLFLQGLLLMPVTKLHAYFSPLKPQLERYRNALAEVGLSPLEGALLFLEENKEIDQAVLGVCSAIELEEILRAKEKVESLPQGSFDFSSFSIDDPQMVNPALWKTNG